MKKIYNRFMIRKALLKNKVYLYLLQKSFKLYRNHSKNFVKALSDEVLWTSGIDTDERTLDQCQKILDKRSKIR